MTAKTIRIFISSPGDVADERDRARGVIQQLRRTFAGRLELEAILWEQLPLSADASFQDGIDLVLSSQGIDIAVFILWSRLGSPTGPLRLATDGREYRSGTEREWALMWRSREQARSQALPLRPEILVYTRQDVDSFHQRQRNHSDELRQQELQQKLQVNQFIREEFQDAETGRNLRAYHSFDKPVTFAQTFRDHLTKLLESLTGQSAARPFWDSVEQGPPFRGLQNFENEHAGIFFGREDEIVAIRSQLREQACRNCAFLLISGGSGSGKSSLARAGVMPDICLHELDDTVQHWVRLSVRPGDLGERPLLGLLQLLQSPDVLPRLSQWSAELQLPPADASVPLSDAWLAGFQLRIRDALGAVPGTTGPRRLLLLVDQLEELFTHSSVSTAACSELFAAVETLARSGVVWVLATVRSDFYHECQKHPALVRMKRELGHFDLLPPTSDGLLRVITSPALLAGLRFEPEQVTNGAPTSTRTLADVILREAADQAELLPLLEHLLLDLYEHRRDGLWLTFNRYRELGGLQGALRQHCERVFQELPAAAQAAFPAVLSRLISLSGDTLDAAVRRVVRLDSLKLGTADRALVEALVRGRILAAATDPQGNSVVSVAHEAVLRTWTRVLEWTAQNREHLRLRGRVEQQEQRWREAQSDDSLLLNAGVPLREGQRLLREAPHLLNPETTDYITRSLKADAARLVQQKRRRTIAVAALALLLASAFIGWIQLRRQADERQATALTSGIARTNISDLAEALKRLQELRQYALPKLQQLYQQSETAEQLQLAIARLQLGDTAAELLPTARDQTLESQPEQLLPLAQLLRPWTAQLQPELQRILQNEQQTARNRLHAACLLAAWEPSDGDKTTWAQPATATFVAGQLAALNPVFVGTYQEVLRPQARHLIAPLATLFADPRQSEVARTIVTGLLADYAKDDVPVLAQTLLTADPVADKLLFPLLEADRARAITEFQTVLHEQVTTDWADPPLNPAWSAPTDTVKSQITAAHGVVAERSAFCLDMPLQELLQVVQNLQGSGYRPVRLRPVVGTADQTLRMSAVWVRDGGRFAVQPGLPPADLPQPDVNATRDGLLLADLAFVPGSDSQAGWLTLWSEPVVAGEERRCLVGVAKDRFLQGIAQVAAAADAAAPKYSQLTVSVHTDADGQPLYSGVFSTQGYVSETLASWPGHDRLDLVQKDVTSAATGQPQLTDPRAGYRQQLEQIAALPAELREQPQIRLIQANALYQTDQLEAALSELDWLTANLPTPNATVLQYRSVALARLQRQEAAAKVFAEFQQTSPSASLADYVAIQMLAAGKDPAAVITALDSAAARHAGSVYDLYNIACAAALSSSILRQLEIPDGATQLREKALSLLTACISGGYSNGQHLSSDADFAELHSDPRFTRLLSQLLPADRAAGLWQADPQVETMQLQAATAVDLQAQVGQWLADWWRPIAVHLDPDGGQRTAVLVLQRPLIADARKESLAIRQGAAAVALLRLGVASNVWPLLESRPDPRLRSEILYRLSLYGVDGRALLTQLQSESGLADPAVVSRRRGLIQGLGELAAANLLPPDVASEVTSDLLQRFTQDPDAGVHGICEWSLRQLGAAEQLLQAEQQFRTGEVTDGRRWYLTKTAGSGSSDRGLSFAIVDAREPFVMGSPLSEAERFEGPNGQYERRHRRRVGRVVAIGMHEVTVAQFLKFRPQHNVNKVYSPTADSPVNSVTWYDAAAYCNWLSEQENIAASDWCYEAGDNGYAEGMRIKPNCAELRGYRLLTEAEWEFGCRGGTQTSRYFGETDRLLGAYAWYAKNSGDKLMQPVSALRPNGAGLFGLYGNAFEWCQDEAVLYSLADVLSVDTSQGGEVSNDSSRVLRGGSFNNSATNMRSANRNSYRPDNRSLSLGFRVSRTYPLPP